MAPGLDVRTVSTVTAVALAVADMIGIGVFTSLGFQVKDIPSAFAVLMLWVIGGIAALCGALGTIWFWWFVYRKSLVNGSGAEM